MNTIKQSNIKVVILCGGLGTRLREETEFLPKPMVKIGDKPILWHIMKIYAQYGLKDFVLCLGYKGEMIKDYFLNYEALNNDFTVELGKNREIEIYSTHEENGWRVTLADTGDKTLKGARLKKVEKYINDSDTFMLTYGDGLAKIDLNTLLVYHQSHGKMVTVTGVSPASRFGELKVSDNQVESFIEKPAQGSELINGGFLVVNKGIFDYLSLDENCDLEYGALEEIAKKGQLMVYKHKDFWACMDTYRDLECLNKKWNENNAEWKVW